MPEFSLEELFNTKKFEIKTHYSGWSWFLFTIIGMSATPSKVEFIDKNTGVVIKSSTDSDLLKKCVGR